MKDAYSFHESQECLESYYIKVFEAYERIFKRVGLNECISIESDPGMMGGSGSHEFMALADCGEDIIFMSEDGKYKANREVATAAWDYRKEEFKELEKVHTPGRKSIEEVAEFLGIDASQTGKAVFFKDVEGVCIFAMIRGDFEVNEAKLKKLISSPVLDYADDSLIKESGAEPGYASPLGLDYDKIKIVVDNSIKESSNLVVGANEPDYHYKNFNFDRDMVADKVISGDIASVREGDICKVTGTPLKMKRGIEVGNIFKLGTKYTESMNCMFLDANGKSKPMIMGCYGIGVGRAMASVIEQSYDEWGPIWPITIAPYEVQLCSLNPKKEGVKETAEKLYEELKAAGVEVLYDDRGEKAGFMFKDADLTGIPLRLTVSPKNIEEGKIEFKFRGSADKEFWTINETVSKLKEIIAKEYIKYNN
jgi:prolyl-tRNA synthetase